MKIKITDKSNEKFYFIIDLAKLSAMRQFYDADKKRYSFYFVSDSGNRIFSPCDFNTEEYELEFFDHDGGTPCLKKTTIGEIALAFGFES